MTPYDPAIDWSLQERAKVEPEKDATDYAHDSTWSRYVEYQDQPRFRFQNWKLLCRFGHRFGFRGGRWILPKQVAVTYSQCERTGCYANREVSHDHVNGLRFLEREWNLMDEEPMLQFFKYDHLPEKLQTISKPFGELADNIVRQLPRNPERTVALRKLLEAKDCAVRAQLFK